MLNQAAWQVMRNKEDHSGLRMTFYRFSPLFLSETYENRKEKLHNTGRLKIIRLATAGLQITVSHGTSANQNFLESDKIF